MKILRVSIETAWCGCSEVVDIEIEEDMSQEDIEDLAKETFQDYCNYGFHILEEGEDV
ncbi:hypothetical protein MOO17_11485 [Escherichia coli]|uniref:hypothetical protein n=1 Tax=Escherichia coli TaxID=562 RepID=UPI001FF30FF6|nr:hypothetical protein [Escherichia coli]MCJ8478652.1 hypothetical protein [Escherichia coli]